ncbi:hypothetical protein BCR33DRAFT_716998 [Rhizoclosmatium globosum]|uniref:Uncharacterized protein n=1 Tax=Rhizoclosmatium globosum TaxID=329046 RepID=A0A1Y2CBT0_9FUNG|nr:hypothetical protein BCR33DRAFT_716998 [Rhizoclosmatium globosum]|eukprot:ORY44488.1 hypothetical protein BCR33DRAFT_716998 [Rhizoclosmatium globosum]
MAAASLVMLSQQHQNPLAYNSEVEAGPNMYSDSEPPANIQQPTARNYYVPGDEMINEAGLEAMEAEIDLKILNQVSGDALEVRQDKFKKTVTAVQAIVAKKLYRAKSVSLELYFKEHWKISRAQVYRFLDCAAVLQHLDGFTRIPIRERLCRTLKSLAKNRHDIRILWAACLSQIQGNTDTITSTMLNHLWTDLLAERKVSGIPEANLVLPLGWTDATWEKRMDGIAKEYGGEWMSDDGIRVPTTPAPALGGSTSSMQPTIKSEQPSPESSHPPPQTEPFWNSFCSKHKAPIFSDVSTLLESSDSEGGCEQHQPFTSEELTALVHSLSNVDRRNHHLEYFENGEWKHARSFHWRVRANNVNNEQTLGSVEPAIMLTNAPAMLPPPPKSIRPYKKASRPKALSAKRSSSSRYIDESSDFAPTQAVPVAAEPPHPSKHRRELEEYVEEDTDGEDNSSDYYDDAALPSRIKKKPRCLTNKFASTSSVGAVSNVEFLSDAIADEVMESCWKDFAPEELEAVAVLQKYRFDRQSASPVLHMNQGPEAQSRPTTWNRNSDRFPELNTAL